MDTVNRYTYRVVWSEEDQEFAGLCAEFPSLSHLEKAQPQALAGIVELVRGVVADMADSGESPPVPLSDREYSGELRVRMPPGLHRRLAMRAAEEKTSINRLILEQISA